MNRADTGKLRQTGRRIERPTDIQITFTATKQPTNATSNRANVVFTYIQNNNNLWLNIDVNKVAHAHKIQIHAANKTNNSHNKTKTNKQKMQSSAAKTQIRQAKTNTVFDLCAEDVKIK